MTERHRFIDLMTSAVDLLLFNISVWYLMIIQQGHFPPRPLDPIVGREKA